MIRTQSVVGVLNSCEFSFPTAPLKSPTKKLCEKTIVPLKILANASYKSVNRLVYARRPMLHPLTTLQSFNVRRLNSTDLNFRVSLQPYFSLFLLASALAVMVVEGPDVRYIDQQHHVSRNRDPNFTYTDESVLKRVKAATAWYNALVYLSDAILFLCLLTLLGIFANAILFQKTACHSCIKRKVS